MALSTIINLIRKADAIHRELDDRIRREFDPIKAKSYRNRLHMVNDILDDLHTARRNQESSNNSPSMQ